MSELLSECYSRELHKRSMALWVPSRADAGRVGGVLELLLRWIRDNDGELLKTIYAF